MRIRYLLLACLAASPVGAAEQATPEQVDHFERKIRPVLVAECLRCHGGEAKIRGKLRLDSRASLLAGGESGPAVVPGKPDTSPLVLAVRQTDADLSMPPKKKLPAGVIADFEKWVRDGAAWPGDVKLTPGSTGEAGPALEAFDLVKRKARHWAWQPVRWVEPPAVRDAAWARDPLDRFVLAGLEAKQLSPAPAADRATWLRRVHFLLTGLPPSSEEIEAFLADKQPGAEGRAVDTLLASPAYGEHWARHWLDLVRYGETRGHEFDPEIANAWQYRDYVVRALNADLPYDRFVREHLAGDVMDKPRLDAKGNNESVLGTGFWHLGEEVHSPVDPRQDQADRYDNRLDVFGKTFLAMTVACARCHDHKYDAISARDYYSLYALLEGSNYRQVRFQGWEANRRAARERADERQAATKALAGAFEAGQKSALSTSEAAGYWLAAAELLARNQSADAGKRGEVAAAKKLDPARLARWVAALDAARRDPADLMHPWAKFAVESALVDAREFPARAAAWKQQAGAARKPSVEVVPVIDYATAKPGEFLPDDVGFGPAPVAPGTARVTAGKVHELRFEERPAAAFDRFWDGLTLAPGTQRDFGAFGGQERPGFTLRLPVFTVQKKHLWYLARGAGVAYAGIGNHTLVAGPLHAGFLRPFPASADYRWIPHDVSAHQGQRVHLELTAARGSDFALAAVVQSDAMPPLPSPDDADVPAPDSAEKLAELACHRLLEPQQPAGVEARRRNWLLAHPDLTGADRAPVDAAVKAALGSETELAKKVVWQSAAALALFDGPAVGEQVFVRGSPRSLGEKVAPRMLEAFHGDKADLPSHGSGRRELADELTDPARDPLFTRVIVNRLWHYLLGRGLVASTDNFGVLGELPGNPELLDYLADEFRQDGFSLKHMVRRIALSATFAQSSKASPEAAERDPANAAWHCYPLKRLEGESIRDALLTISGRLEPAMGGPSVLIHLTPFLDGRGRPASGPVDGAGRRSLYLATRRNFLSPFMLAFDTPSPFSTVGRRQVSNVPAQALILMNDPFVQQQAELWARALLKKPAPERLKYAYLQAFGRVPTPEEESQCREFLGATAAETKQPADGAAVWKELCHALVNVKEFIYLK